MTYTWWEMDYFNKSVYSPTTLRDAFARYLDSALVGEFGIVSYLVSFILFILSLIFGHHLKKIWIVVSLIPIVIASLLILIIRYA